MLTEFSAVISALKEITQLVKIFSDAKTEAEVRSAVDALNSKLISAQCECMSLIDLARSYQEETVALKAKIAEYEDFRSETAGYDLNPLDSGTVIRSKKMVLNGKEVTVHLCPACFTNKKVSILQPSQVSGYTGFHQSQCLLCDCRIATSAK